MADLKYQPVRHNHTEFLATAQRRPGFNNAYDSLELEYTLANQMLKARAKAGLSKMQLLNAWGRRKVPYHVWKTPAVMLPRWQH